MAGKLRPFVAWLRAWTLLAFFAYPVCVAADAGAPAPSDEPPPVENPNAEGQEPAQPDDTAAGEPGDSPENPDSEGAEEPPSEEVPAEAAGAAGAAAEEPQASDPSNRGLVSDVNSGQAEDRPGFAGARRDFLNRLRSTAETIESSRRGERTRVSTEDGVTVLSNVAPREEFQEDLTRPVTEIQPVGQSDDAPSREAGDPNAKAEISTGEVTALAVGKPGLPPDEDGWSWLWLLGGTAIVLLVPIAFLLSRATRAR